MKILQCISFVEVRCLCPDASDWLKRLGDLDEYVSDAVLKSHVNVFPQLLQCDGNLYDAISIAIKAALFNTKWVIRHPDVLAVNGFIEFSCIWQLFLGFHWQNSQSFHIIRWRRREGNRAVGWPLWLHEAQCRERPLYSDAVQSKLGFFHTCCNRVESVNAYTSPCFACRWATATSWTPLCRRRRALWRASSCLSHTKAWSPAHARWEGEALIQRASLRWQRWGQPSQIS